MSSRRFLPEAPRSSLQPLELAGYFVGEQPQPLAQVHAPLQGQLSPHVQREGVAAHPHEVV